MCTRFVIFLVLLYQTSALYITNPDNVSEHYLSPYYKHFGLQPPFNVSGSLAFASPIDGCKPFTNDLHGKIAIVQPSDYMFCPPLVQANYAKNAGAVGLIITRKSNLGYYANMPYRCSEEFDLETGIPTVEWVPSSALFSDLRNLIAANLTIHVEIIPEASPYDQLELFISLSIFLGSISLANLIQCTYKLSQYIKYHGIQRSYPQLTLSLEIFIAIVRMTFFVEPLPYIGLYPAWARDMLYTITYPFTIFSLMTLLLHWHKMVSPNSHLRMDPGLNNLKWPLIIVTLLWTFVTINLIILSGMSLNGSVFYRIINTIYGALLVGLIIFFVITATRTIRFLKSQSLTAAAEHTKKVIRMVVINSSALTVLITDVVLLLAIVRTMAVQVIIVTLTSTALLAMSHAQINIVDTPTDELTNPRQAVIEMPSSDSMLNDYGSSVLKYPKLESETPYASNL